MHIYNRFARLKIIIKVMNRKNETDNDDDSQKMSKLKSFGNTLKADAKSLLEVSDASLDLVEDIGVKTVPLLLQFALPFGILFLIGFALILIRIVLIDGAPYIIEHAKMFSVWATGVRDSLMVMGESLSAVIYFITASVDALKGKNPPNPIQFAWPKKISATDLIDFFNRVLNCASFTSKEAFLYTTRTLGHSTFCPILRASTPLRWINTTVVPAFDWLSFPYEPYDSDVAGLSNCEVPEENETFCAALHVGNLIIEVLLPTAVFILIFIRCFFSIFRLVWKILKLAFNIIKTQLEIVDI